MTFRPQNALAGTAPNALAGTAPNALAGTALIALAGTPNAGKSSLFNALTGGRQKIGNYPGVTVERRLGRAQSGSGEAFDIIDLPGTYSLSPKSPDEAVTCDVLRGNYANERRPDAVICVVSATNLRTHLRLVLEIMQLGLPVIVALNMMDLAARDGIEIDIENLSAKLGVPVIPTVAVRKRGIAELLAATPKAIQPENINPHNVQKRARSIAEAAILREGVAQVWTRKIDAWVLHPIIGFIILGLLLFVMFQAVFSWAEVPMDLIDSGVGWIGTLIKQHMAQGLLRSLIVDGIIVGVGSVIVFLPQILILFFFIILLEQSGYMTRAAFLMDQVMAKVGLNGRAFIPLLSSFACAIPGIMATRSIDNPRDRLTTILIAPLMTCSARLPVYAMIIAAFIPAKKIAGLIGLQGLVLFSLYLVGIVSAFLVAFVLRRTLTRGAAQPLLMEMPPYHQPAVRDIIIGLYSRAKLFLKRAGTIILASMILLWAFSAFPSPPEGATGPAINYSLTGYIGRALEVVFAPIGFNREIAIALVPGMAAREVAVGALGTVYALQGDANAVAGSLVDVLRAAWSLPTALAFLAWYVFAPQCISTLAVTRRETNSWRWPVFMFGYLCVMAYLAAGVTYWTARWWLD
jgi:ferrous iron transport protein B